MEASAKTVLKCVCLLSMLVLSLAAPQDSVVVPNTSVGTCAQKCGLSCALSIEDPPVFFGCFALCVAACKIPGPTSDEDVAVHGCTRSCVSSVRKFWTPNHTRSSVSDLKSYAQGYVDSCSYRCSNSNKLF